MNAYKCRFAGHIEYVVVPAGSPRFAAEKFIERCGGSDCDRIAEIVEVLSGCGFSRWRLNMDSGGNYYATRV